MTDEEIVKSYLEAKDKNKQISILSDLTLLSTKDIKAVLTKNGVYPPKKKSAPKEKRTAMPDAIKEAINMGVEHIDEKIAQKEKEIAEASQVLEEMKKRKDSILEYMARDVG